RSPSGGPNWPGRHPHLNRSTPPSVRRAVPGTGPPHPPLDPSAPARAAGLGCPGLALRKYAKILRVSLIERMAYRGDFFLSTFLRFLPMVTTILLWEAIYDGAGGGELEGFSRKQMIAYLLLVHISRMFSSMPGLAPGIARDIR